MTHHHHVYSRVGSFFFVGFELMLAFDALLFLELEIILSLLVLVLVLGGDFFGLERMPIFLIYGNSIKKK